MVQALKGDFDWEIDSVIIDTKDLVSSFGHIGFVLILSKSNGGGAHACEAMLFFETGYCAG